MKANISTIIWKPTKFCNAQCTYCSAPPEINGAAKWSLDDFKRTFDKLIPYLTGNAVIIWHGGEPMLMGPRFYEEAYEYKQKMFPGAKFSIQTNLLGYSSLRWKDVFRDIMGGSVSTSFDPDTEYRLFKGSADLYQKIFYKKLEEVIADGFMPKIIGTYDSASAHLADTMYDKSLEYGGFNIRFNYRYPAGRDIGKGEQISPKEYGNMLIRLYNRWIKEVPNFVITPLDEMLKKVLEVELHRCPWTKSCGGHFFGIEPNGDVYNCSEFADLDDSSWSFGNIFEDSVDTLLKSKALRMIRRRPVKLPFDCTVCRHFKECEGGCMRDAILYDRGLGGKFYYCGSWKMVFDRIKESVLNGEADNAIRMYNLDPQEIRDKKAFKTEDDFVFKKEVA